MEERDDVIVDTVADVLRNEPIRKLSGSFDARVMAGIRWNEQSRGVRKVAGWFVRPRRLSVSPLGGLALAAAIAAVAYLGAASGARGFMNATARSSVAQSSADATRGELVQFVLVAPDARSVSLVGDFNDWNETATPLKSTAGNVWTVQVELAPGRYNYVFMVDGAKLVPDPKAPKAPADEFGQRNSVITVGGSVL